jgi:iron complex outermembrane receptor protein
MDALPLTTAARLATALICLAPAIPAEAAAHETRAFHVAGGALSSSLSDFSNQAEISISVSDASLWNRPVKAVRGRMSVEKALRLWLRSSGARAVRVTATSWRIDPIDAVTRQPARAPVRAKHRPSITPPPPIPVQDIIVTGSKSQIPYSHFAGTATLIGSDDMEFGGERGTETLMRQSASLSSTHLGTGRNKLFLRGIADSSFTGPTQSTVGQYLGDIRLSYNAPDPDLRLYDMDGVEVIEGPQGTLYGAGSLGGIIRMIPSAPHGYALETQAIAGASLTQHGKPGGDLALITNIPLQRANAEGGHALRAVGYMVSEGGYIDNDWLGHKDVNRTHIRGGRASLRLVASDRLLIDISGIYQHNRADDAQYADLGGDDLTRNSPIIQASDAKYALASLVLTRELGDYELRSSHAYIRHDLDERFDASPNPTTPQALNQHNRTRLWVSETRLSRPFFDKLGWVIGLSYIRNETQQIRDTQSLIARIPATGVRNDISEWTAYGNLTYALTPRLVAAGGLRLSYSRLNGSGEDISAAELALARAAAASRNDADILPTASLLYTVDQGLRLYLSYAQGFRPGGLAVDRGGVRRFRHDRIETWEAGARWTDALGLPIDASVSLSHNRWRDIQADFIDGNGFPTTANIGNGRITSLSAVLAVRASSQLSFELAGIINHSRVDTLSSEASGLLQQWSERQSLSLPLGVSPSTRPLTSGTALSPLQPSTVPASGRIPNVASHSLRGSAGYAMIVGAHDLRLNGWVQYVGPSRLGIGPILGHKQGNYVDSGVAMRLGDDRRGLSVTLTNPLDTRGNRFALGTPFQDRQDGFITPLRPRTLRIAIDMAY